MFSNPYDFPIAKALEDGFPLIRDEYLSSPLSAYRPWKEVSLYGIGWNVLPMYAFGEPIKENWDYVPKTLEVLSEFKVVTAAFSRLNANTHIRPHKGYVYHYDKDSGKLVMENIDNIIYRIHLGLVVPENCAIRVEKEVKAWEEGKCLMFNDALEHEAWNRSSKARGVLLVDFEV